MCIKFYTHGNTQLPYIFSLYDEVRKRLVQWAVEQPVAAVDSAPNVSDNIRWPEIPEVTN
jgi:hypothetical protein